MKQLNSLSVEIGRGRYYEEAIYSLALIYNFIDDRISSHLQPFDLTPGKFNILMVIKHQGKDTGISQVEVSKRLVVTPSNMTKLIDKLQRDGLVERLAQEGDRRVNIVRATKKGSALLDRVWAGYDRQLKILMEKVSVQDQKILAQGLQRWLDILVKGQRGGVKL